MRIGFFGNANNYPFTLARAVQRRDVDVQFLVDSTQPLNRPEYRYEDISLPYPDWITDVSPFRLPNFAFWNPKRTRVVRILKSCDALIVNGLGPALLPHIGSRPVIAVLTGSDLIYYADQSNIDRPHPTTPRLPEALWRAISPHVVKASNRLIIPNQRAGIASAAAVHWFPKGVVPAGDALLDDLGVRDERRFFFMMADLDQIELMPLPDNERLRIFSATRLTWKRPFPAGFSDFDDKGSDVMIRGLGMFRRITQTRLDIRLVKKGMHVEESMALAAEEGVADQITWLEEMSQAEVREEYKRADIVVEQLRSSMMGMAGLDAMATGRPVIANVRPDTAKSWLKAVPPVCQATDAETVCAHLQRLTNRDERQRVGIAARRFAEHFFSPDAAAEQCLQRLSAASMSAAERQPAAAR